MKKFAILLLTAALTAAMLSSCSGAESKKLVMGTNAEFPPFEFVSDTDNAIVDKFTGIDVAIANEVAKKAGKELQVDNMEFTAVLAAVPAGKVDFAFSGMTVTDERKESMDFSDPYCVATQYMLVLQDNDTINSAADLMDKKVGAIDGYTGQLVCMETLKIPNLSGYKTPTTAVLDLLQGKIDVLVMDSYTALALIKNNPTLKYIEDPTVFETEEYAAAVKKGNTQMLTLLNETIAELKANGKIDEFIALYSAQMVE